MAKQAIFVVHGMGDFKSGWCDSTAKLIEALYNGYEIAKLLPFEEQFKVVPVTYNDFFDGLRERWEENAKSVIDKMSFVGGTAGSALTALNKFSISANKKEFWATHLLDVVLYRFVPTVADKVHASVVRQLRSGMKGFERWSVIGHSLGTSVLHDSLVWMFDPNSPDYLEPQKSRFQTIAMLANVSRVLEPSEYGEAWDVYKSVVQPNIDVTKGTCNRFLNVWHNWDPIPVPKKFKPQPDWPDQATRAVDGAYRDIKIDEIEAFDDATIVHDLEHYLRNPRVHIPLFRSMIPIPGIIPDPEAKKAIDAHVAKTPLAKAQKLIDRLKDFRLADEEEDWGEILAKLLAFLSEKGS